MGLNMKLPIYKFKPASGAEWGSGGIFGLKYHMGVLYFTLSFDAKAYFFRDNTFRKYNFELVGPEPRSGGDTYNAVEAVDNKIFFGGWVHSPVRYKVMDKFLTIDFSNKYSHLHQYDVYEDEVTLLWKESAGLENEWVGEISSIVYDPLNNGLLISRADGNRSLGVFRFNLGERKMEFISDKPSLKGSIMSDLACFDISIGINGIYGIQCLDLVRNSWSFKWFLEDLKDISVDGEGVLRPIQVGSIASAYGRLFVFVRGGVIIWDPSEKAGDDLYFIRLYDFCRKDYGPIRTNHVVVGGGIIMPFNAYSHGTLKIFTDDLRLTAKNINYIPTSSNLLYITPPNIRVLTSLGARITSVEHIGSELVLGTNTMPNLGIYDVTPFDVGERELLFLSIDTLLASNPPLNTIKVLGSIVGNNAWGGIPLSNYRKALLHVKASKDNKLKVYEYDIGLPPSLHNVDVIDIKVGRNFIDLSNYNNIISFKFEVEDYKAEIQIDLRN